MSDEYDKLKEQRERIERKNVFEGGIGDGRQSELSDIPMSDALFRKRYRQLTQGEIKLHDEIKDKASELAALIGEMNIQVYYRILGAHPPMAAAPGVKQYDAANVTLAIRHIEDGVYRAVKALTA